jgi:magnesium chelatase subunit I
MPVRHQGNESLFLAVEMSLVSTLAGIPLHVHAEGLRGTGKTTVMRWARQALPRITRISGCPYQCDPEKPRCPQHAAASLGAGREEIPMPFVEIGHGAKLGTILGSIDLSRLTNPSRPEAALLPGSIPMANRGIIFVDEVNRLAETAPELTDVLLSVMGTKPGLVKIEEVGLPPCEIEVTCSVWAASNPDEDPGPLEDIRRQLADRFDVVVPVQRPSDPAVVERLLSGATGPDCAPFSGLAEKASRLKDVRVPPEIVRYMAHLYVHRNVESLRAVEAMELASRLHAAIRGKDEVTFDEVLAVIPLVLRHRVEPATLSEILKDLELRNAAGSQARPPEQPRDKSDGSNGRTADAGGSRGQGADGLGAPGTGKPGEPRGPKGPESGMRTRTGWFERLVERYRGAVAKSRPGQAPGSAGPGTAARPRRLPDPSTLPAASPPDRARRISSIGWEELVVPPEWKGGAT